MNSSSSPQIILVGARGFGGHHLAHIRELEARGAATLTAIADPALAAQGASHEGVPVYPSLGAALADHQANGHRTDIVVIATPIGTHEDICITAMRAGADVLLEKPPVPSLAAFERLCAVQAQTGRAVQVGFQSFGSHAVEWLRDTLADSPAPTVNAVGLWSRPLEYWARARWAGKRILDGAEVMDGVVTNPLAHAVATALRVAGLNTVADVREVEVELFHANDIDSDDTSVVRVRGTNGATALCTLTLCAPNADEDLSTWVEAPGPTGPTRLYYRTDEVSASGQTTAYGRTDLLENLIEFRAGRVALLAPLADTGAFMTVVEAVRTAQPPTLIDPSFVTWMGSGPDARPVITGITESFEEAARTGKTLTELGVEWAHANKNRVLATFAVAGDHVATYQDGAGTIGYSSPRPYLHPITTRSGVIVSDHHPGDHDWHLGLSYAIPQVDGVNFWGGRTYVRDQGYVHLRDHGTVRSEQIETAGGLFTQRLAWRGPDQELLLTEKLTFAPCDLGPEAWQADLNIWLTNAKDSAVTLASPGSVGREGAGYGGLFWRLPANSDTDVMTELTSGEQHVHGQTAPWVAWSAHFEAGPETSGDATVVLLGGNRKARVQPWFVRQGEYPALGAAIVWDRPLILAPGESLHLKYGIIVADGKLTRAQTKALVEQSRVVQD